MNFFSKNWNIDQFFPIKKEKFNGITVSIPNNPKYFLEINYGRNYMNTYVSSNWNHKNEKSRKNVITYTKKTNY